MRFPSSLIMEQEGSGGFLLLSTALKAALRWLQGPRVVGERPCWAAPPSSQFPGTPTRRPRKQLCWQKGEVRALSCCDQEWPEVSWGQVGTLCPLPPGPGCVPPPSLSRSELLRPDGGLAPGLGGPCEGEGGKGGIWGEGSPMVAPLRGRSYPRRRHCGHSAKSRCLYSG